MTENAPLTPEYVRLQLDEILARQITSFLDIDFDTAMISFNLATISCITLIVEREREIKQYQDFPPERYMLDSFYSELTEIGLDRDDYLDTAVTACFEKGYLRQDDKQELFAEMPAFMMAGILDSMFPGMQGLNLIAFVLQMNDEVNANRKSLDLAKKSFESSLKSRGVSVSGENATQRASEMAAGKARVEKQNREVAQKLKQANLNRLSKLVKNRRKRSDDYTRKVQVKDVFDRGPSPEEVAAREEEIKRAEASEKKTAELERELARKEERITALESQVRDAAEQLRELALKEARLDAAQQVVDNAREQEASLKAREAEIAEQEATLAAMETRIRQEEEQVRLEKEAVAASRLEVESAMAKAVESTPAAPVDEADLASRIAAFEEELSMPCPLCSEGKIVSNQTQKGQTYYACDNPDCRFVSWDKPYHFTCPLCKNPFLTAAQSPDGAEGLKCPRAACSYTQDTLLDPAVHMANTAGAAHTANDAEPKKKRRLVRRKKRG